MDAPGEVEGLHWQVKRVEGRRAAYGVAGSGRPLLFLHGWGLGHRSYRRALTRMVGAGVRVWAPAMPGFGGTADLPPEDVSLAGYAQWVADFVRAVDVPTPLVLVGHSFGGGVAIQTAHDHPDLVDRLVVVNSIGGSAWTDGRGVLRSIADRPLWDWGLHLQADLLPARQVSRVLPVVVEDALTNVLRNPRSRWRVGRLAARTNLVAELEELKQRGTPVVVLWGTGDRVVPAACLESIRSALGDVDVVTVPGSHSWLLADPDGFAEVMTNVIAAVPVRAADGRLGRRDGGAGRRAG